MYVIFLIFALLGLIGGIIVGILGSGISLVVLPVLSIVFPKIDISNSIAIHLAAGTCMATLLVACSITCFMKLKHGEKINWQKCKLLIPAAIIGAVFGASIAHFIPGHILKIYIAVFIVLIGLKMLFKSKAPPKHLQLSPALLFILTFLICSLTSVAGIAIGILLVPLLCKCGCEIKESIFTAVFVTLFYTIAGTLTFVFNGLHVANLPAYSLGYVYLPAFFTISIAACIGAPIGVKLAKRIPVLVMHYGFAVFLLIASVNLLFG